MTIIRGQIYRTVLKYYLTTRGESKRRRIPGCNCAVSNAGWWWNHFIPHQMNIFLNFLRHFYAPVEGRQTAKSGSLFPATFS